MFWAIIRAKGNKLTQNNIVLNAASCEDGDVRLVGGNTEYEGLLEVCFSQRWGTVNGDGWSAADSEVVCRQLGYSYKGTYMYV